MMANLLQGASLDMMKANITLVNAYNIDQMYFIQVADQLRQLNQPLSVQGIIHFSHLRRWPNNIYSILTTDPAFSVTFVKQKFYAKVFGGALESYQSGAIFMRDIDEHCRFLQDASVRLCGFKTDLMLIRKHQLYVDFYWFGSSSDQLISESFYLNHMTDIGRFIDDFRMQGRRILLDTYANQLTVSDRLGEIDPLKSCKFYESMGCLGGRIASKSCSSLVTHAQRCGFTSQETHCANLLVEGLSAKTMAKRLFLSPRTVEKHISKLREKIACHTTLELVVRLLNT